MDPNATVERLVNAIEEHDYDEASQAARDLALWLRRGGAAPSIAPHTLEFIFDTIAEWYGK